VRVFAHARSVPAFGGRHGHAASRRMARQIRPPPSPCACPGSTLPAWTWSAGSRLPQMVVPGQMRVWPLGESQLLAHCRRRRVPRRGCWRRAGRYDLGICYILPYLTASHACVELGESGGRWQVAGAIPARRPALGPACSRAWGAGDSCGLRRRKSRGRCHDEAQFLSPAGCQNTKRCHRTARWPRPRAASPLLLPFPLPLVLPLWRRPAQVRTERPRRHRRWPSRTLRRKQVSHEVGTFDTHTSMPPSHQRAPQLTRSSTHAAPSPSEHYPPPLTRARPPPRCLAALSICRLAASSQWKCALPICVCGVAHGPSSAHHSQPALPVRTQLSPMLQPRHAVLQILSDAWRKLGNILLQPKQLGIRFRRPACVHAADLGHVLSAPRL